MLKKFLFTLTVLMLTSELGMCYCSCWTTSGSRAMGSKCLWKSDDHFSLYACNWACYDSLPYGVRDYYWYYNDISSYTACDEKAMVNSSISATKQKRERPAHPPGKHEKASIDAEN